MPSLKSGWMRSVRLAHMRSGARVQIRSSSTFASQGKRHGEKSRSSSKSPLPRDLDVITRRRLLTRTPDTPAMAERPSSLTLVSVSPRESTTSKSINRWHQLGRFSPLR